jgi:hypothetical protein
MSLAQLKFPKIPIVDDFLGVLGKAFETAILFGNINVHIGVALKFTVNDCMRPLKFLNDAT